jgi:hypothetical protein
MIEQAPSFFVHGVPRGEYEASYSGIAQACSRTPLPAHERIFSIEFPHDGVDWTATVGRQLHGIKIIYKRGREFRAPRSDPAIVLAIFSPEPYIVVTSGKPFGADRSAWANPFMAGKPTYVVLFQK